MNGWKTGAVGPTNTRSFFFDYKVGAVLQIFFAAITSPTTYTYIRTTALV
jgi:hypothetical protein